MENTLPNMEKVDESYKVPNLEKGIAVLEYLSLRSAGETLQDIKSALDISQTTAYRILNTLVRLEYLNFSEDTKRYKLSRKLLTLGFRSLNEHTLLETVALVSWEMRKGFLSNKRKDIIRSASSCRRESRLSCIVRLPERRLWLICRRRCEIVTCPT